MSNTKTKKLITPSTSRMFESSPRRLTKTAGKRFGHQASAENTVTSSAATEHDEEFFQLRRITSYAHILRETM